MELGRLGISSLKELSWVLRLRWLWLQKIEPKHPWTSLPIQVPDKAKALFSMAIKPR
jgi:hypothetical protein